MLYSNSLLLIVFLLGIFGSICLFYFHSHVQQKVMCFTAQSKPWMKQTHLDDALKLVAFELGLFA